MTATASPSVLLLAWDHTSDALPVAQALPAATTELWLPEPLAADAAPIGTRVQLLAGELPDAPELASLSTAAPAYPYVGNSTDVNAGNSASGVTPARIAVPAAPYVGSSQLTADPARPQQNESAARPSAEPGIAEAAELSRAQTTVVPTAQRLDEVYFATAEETEEEAQPTGETTAADVQPQPLTDTELAAAESEAAPAPVVASPPVAPTPMAVPEAHELLQAANDVDDLNFRIIQYARHAVRLAHDTPFEVVFAPDWPTWLAGVEICQLTRRPLVLRVKQLAADRAVASERGWSEALERLTLPHADRVLVPDAATAKRLQELYAIPKERVHVLPNDVEPDLTAALVLGTRLSA